VARKYYIPGANLSAFGRIFDRLFRKPLSKVPEIVLIETIAACNAACVFCPLGDKETARQVPKGRMTDELFEKIIDELAANPPKQIIPCFTNEPFLDIHLLARLKLIRERIASAKITVITNGSLLTEKVCREMLEAGVPDLIDISFQGMDRVAYEQTMVRLDFNETRDRIVRFIELQKEMGASSPKIRINMVRTALIEPSIDHARQFWKRLGVCVSVARMENRGGTVVSEGLAEGMRPFRECRRPFNTLVIAFDGTVPLCCVDFTRKTVVGNVKDSTIRDVWNGERMMAIRRAFLSTDSRADLPKMCKDCERAE
jgi:radical SAM protein with 4Fe4S-binding SPASM domain